MSSGLASALLTSMLLHGAGLTALSVVGGSLRAPALPSNLITTELVVPPPPPVPVESMPPPELAQVTPPRLVEKTPLKLTEASRPKVRTPAPPSRPQVHDKPPPGPPLPVPVENQAASAGNVPGPPAAMPAEVPLPPAEGSDAGTGQLFERGDVGVVPGAQASGGGGDSGRAGIGTGGLGDGKPVAGLQPGGEGSGGGVGPLARPLGGYQVLPRYPESARRRGVEGTTLLKIYVSARGLVQDILIERSAGHQDPDLAAMAAVKRWRFAPATRGNHPMAIWVTLPVRFELR